MEKKFVPGDVVPRSGIYRVEHDRHRLMHEATLLEHTCFPACRKCGGEVSFSLICTVESGTVLPFRSNDILMEYSGPADMAE